MADLGDPTGSSTVAAPSGAPKNAQTPPGRFAQSASATKPGAATQPCLDKPTLSTHDGYMQYRRDIDGLRALAVIPVVFFHAKVPGFSGGFVGVDIFFVISGYLITKNIFQDQINSRYSILNFYDRRIRRIFPALFAMMAICSIVACFILLPSELKTYAHALIATTFSVSNVLYWRSSDYFSAPSENNPLLHTWSLSVEEQFYVVLPILIGLAFHLRKQRYLPQLIAGLAIGSLVTASWAVRDHATAAFYLLPTRAWELLIGSFLAVYKIPAPVGRTSREMLCAAGAAMIVAAVVWYTPTTRFPGVAAILPCLGAALIIRAGEEGSTLTSAAMSHPVPVFFGQISYSLYLWHWPLLVFPRIYLMRDLTLPEATALMLAGVAVATLSWRYVERPFRRPGGPGFAIFANRRLPVIPRSMGASLALFLAFGAGGAVLASGLAHRLPPEVHRLDELGSAPPEAIGCRAVTDRDALRVCAPDHAAPSRGKLVLWGDSHAGQYSRSVQRFALTEDLLYTDALHPSCAPLVGYAPVGFDGQANVKCEKDNVKTLDAIERDKTIRVVVLAGRWSRFFFPKSDPESQRLTPMGAPGALSESSASSLPAALGPVLDRLVRRGVTVVVIGQAPEFETELPRCLAKVAWRGLPPTLCRLRSNSLPGNSFESALNGALARRPGVIYLRPADVLCPNGACTEQVAGSPLTWDTDHLAPVAAALVIDHLDLTHARL
ncbi:acyltransferase family protein [Caulobacter sp.]|uniref:acyltransferase family protein n=1 Tax=Caulobacter sp. TaxID=78 RepID=UPI003BAE8552